MGLMFAKNKEDLKRKLRRNISSRGERFNIKLAKTKSDVKGQKLFLVTKR